MYKKIADKLAGILISMESKREDGDISRNIQVISYGIELILSSVINLILVLVMGNYFLGIWKTIVFILFFCPIRQFSGGFHANSYVGCTVGFLILVLAAGYLVSIMEAIWYYLTICIICVIIISIMAPIDTRNKRLGEERRRNCKRVIRYLLCAEVITIIIFYLINNVGFLQAATMALGIEVVLLLLGKIINKQEESNVNCDM